MRMMFKGLVLVLALVAGCCGLPSDGASGWDPPAPVEVTTPVVVPVEEAEAVPPMKVRFEGRGGDMTATFKTRTGLMFYAVNHEWRRRGNFTVHLKRTDGGDVGPFGLGSLLVNEMHIASGAAPPLEIRRSVKVSASEHFFEIQAESGSPWTVEVWQ